MLTGLTYQPLSPVIRPRPVSQTIANQNEGGPVIGMDKVGITRSPGCRASDLDSRRPARVCLLAPGDRSAPSGLGCDDIGGGHSEFLLLQLGPVLTTLLPDQSPQLLGLLVKLLSGGLPLGQQLVSL